jgi:hypothetical protein
MVVRGVEDGENAAGVKEAGVARGAENGEDATARCGAASGEETGAARGATGVEEVGAERGVETGWTPGTGTTPAERCSGALIGGSSLLVLLSKETRSATAGVVEVWAKGKVDSLNVTWREMTIRLLDKSRHRYPL